MRLIDADALLQVLCNEDGAQHEYCYPCKTVLDVVNAQPSAQPEQRWIPCSERMPADQQPVLICFDYEDEWYNNVAVGWLDDFGCWDCWDDRTYVMAEVIAWMPLPEPYTERRTDETN